jgi:hypothetical protein
VEFSGDGAFGSGSGGAIEARLSSSGRPSFPSKAPEGVAYLALLLSVLLTTTVREVIPFVTLGVGSVRTVAVTGYVLTPFVVVGALVWARADGIARQANPWFDVLGLARQLRRLQVTALLSFIVAFDHVTTIATWATTLIG